MDSNTGNIDTERDPSHELEAPRCTQASSEATHQRVEEVKGLIDVVKGTIPLQRVLKNRLDDAKRIADTVNALIVVAAFVAGVQAQIISSTIGFAHAPLDRATNFFAFIGLILDIGGTFFGVIHSIALQSKIRHNSATLNALLSSDSDLSDLLQRAEAGQLNSNTTLDSLKNIRLRLNGVLQDMKLPRTPSLGGAFGSLYHFNSALVTLEGLDAIKPPTFLVQFIGQVISMGSVPLVSMGTGVICLVLSILGLAARALPREVWIGSLLALFVMLSLSLVPIVQSRRAFNT